MKTLRVYSIYLILISLIAISCTDTSIEAITGFEEEQISNDKGTLIGAYELKRGTISYQALESSVATCEDNRSIFAHISADEPINGDYPTFYLGLEEYRNYSLQYSINIDKKLKACELTGEVYLAQPSTNSVSTFEHGTYEMIYKVTKRAETPNSIDSIILTSNDNKKTVLKVNYLDKGSSGNKGSIEFKLKPTKDISLELKIEKINN